MNNKVFFPNLNGLRTVAFLGVFYCHSFYTNNQQILDSPIYQFVKSFFTNGLLGVNLFFVLSGFLITYLLLHEEESTGRINVSNFYLRRVLRIWPLYFACVFYGFVMEPHAMALFGKVANETADPFLFVTFLANFNTIINGGAEAQNLPILWSVAIEEQFYLIWPLLLLLFSWNRYVIFIGLIIISIVFRFFNSDTNVVITYHTLSVISDLAMGGLIGYLSFYSKGFLAFFQKLKRWHIVVVYIAGTIFVFSRGFLPSASLFIAFERFFYSLFFAFIILEQNYSNRSFFKLGHNNFLSALGKYTYGLYCLHLIGITASKEICRILSINDTLMGVLFWQTFLSLTLTMFMAYISYEFFEKYFLILKERFAPSGNLIIEKEKYKHFTDVYDWEILNNQNGKDLYSKSFTFDKPTIEAIVEQFPSIAIGPNDKVWGKNSDNSQVLIAQAPGIFKLTRATINS